MTELEVDLQHLKETIKVQAQLIKELTDKLNAIKKVINNG